MRTIFAILGMSAVAVAIGCSNLPGLRNRTGDQPIVANNDAPPAASLVEFLNANARRVQAIQCNKVAMDCMQGNQAVGLDGQLVCQKPRNFRLKARVVGQPAVDIGSNENEFWYWISKADPPYVFHCDYPELAKGNVRMPFPFQPDMVVAALGIQDYDPAKQYEVKANPRTYELIEQTTSLQGQPVKKITVFDRMQTTGNRPQVIGHVLKDAQGKEICSATVYEVQQHKASGAVLPFKVKLVYPAEKVEMTLRLYDAEAITVDANRAARLFSRADLSNLQSFSLSRWLLDTPGVQQAGATMR